MLIAVPVDSVLYYLESQLGRNPQIDDSEYTLALLEVMRDYLQVMLQPNCTASMLLAELQRSLADVGYPHYRLSSLNEIVHGGCVTLLTTYIPETVKNVSYYKTDYLARRIIFSAS